MTRTDVMASGRPQTARGALIRRGLPSGLRRLPVLSLALLLATALAVPTAAFAAGSTGKENGYSQTAPTPKGSTGTSPAKEKSTATKTVAPTTTGAAPTTSAPSAEAAKASTLPFTGLDLRWTLGVGLLLMAAGFSIVSVQRRHRRDVGR
jgi:hypothetical protein